MPLTVKELARVPEPTAEYERLEERIKAAFRRALYGPLAQMLLGDDGTMVVKRLANARGARGDGPGLFDAITAGRVTLSGSFFRGQFDAKVSKELRDLGAKWDRGARAYRLDVTTLPHEVRAALNVATSRFETRIDAFGASLAKILPEEIAGQIKMADIFDSALKKTDKSISSTLKNISVLPELTPDQRRRVAAEWATNLELDIKTFTELEILRLRKSVQANVLAGNRYEALVRTIQQSYGTTAAKAKFLARQETNLLMAKFKETRYSAAGVHEYRWGCVVGSKLHPVRPAHKALEGKIFTWDNPPITTEPGQPARRNNPGQDYNCRCYARPIVRF